MTWKKLSTKKLLDHPRMQVYEDDIELPSGKKTKYIYVKGHPDAAMVIPIDADGKILVQKEFSYPPNEWLFQFPGGAQDNGESLKETAIRELAEEAGVEGTLHQLGWMYTDNRRKNAKFYVFVATNTVAIKNLVARKDDEEVFEDYWFTPGEIDDLIKKGDINNYSMLAGWAFFVNSEFYKAS